ncbi:hypothetical protein KDA08_03620 [Candidatus Saccharibacteria bacterium]|nr:hypothetical protein [Candidatus Saccharibacteria bacterium]
MQTLSIVGQPNVTITMYSSEEEQMDLISKCLGEKGIDKKKYDSMEFHMCQRRLAYQGATETHFFPVKDK